jgi:hypothetical protein
MDEFDDVFMVQVPQDGDFSIDALGILEHAEYVPNLFDGDTRSSNVINGFRYRAVGACGPTKRTRVNGRASKPRTVVTRAHLCPGFA